MLAGYSTGWFISASFWTKSQPFILPKSTGRVTGICTCYYQKAEIISQCLYQLQVFIFQKYIKVSIWLLDFEKVDFTFKDLTYEFYEHVFAPEIQFLSVFVWYLHEVRALADLYLPVFGPNPSISSFQIYWESQKVSAQLMKWVINQ